MSATNGRELATTPADAASHAAQPRWLEPLLLFVVAVVASVAAAQSWNSWLDPIVDTGRDLYIPEQLLRGAKLYRDIRYQYPPLVPYLLAAITTVIGHSLAAYTAIGIAQSAAIVAGLWVSLRKVAGVLAAFVASLLFVSLSFCGATTWGANFVFPYSYASTIGMVFVVAALAGFVLGRNALALFALLLAAWCKVEYAVAALLIVAVLFAARRISWRQAAAFSSAAATSLAAVALYFRDTHWLRENLFASSLTEGATARRFFSVVSGRADWLLNTGEALAGVALIAAIVFAIRLNRPLFTVPLVLLLSAVGASHAFLRAWGILEWGILLFLLWKRREDPLLLFALFSVATTLRIPLNVSPFWYGFVLIVPVYALIACVLLRDLPLLLKSPHAAVLWLPLVVLICARDLIEQRGRFAVKAFPIHSVRGTLLDWNSDRAKILNAFIQGLPSGTMAVMPEGITLNYLTRTTTPLTYHTFTPVETADPRAESEILRELEQRTPQRVVIVRRDVAEYGFRGFGEDYDLRVASFLYSNYRLEAQWRAPKFFLVVLRRK